MNDTIDHNTDAEIKAAAAYAGMTPVEVDTALAKADRSSIQNYAAVTHLTDRAHALIGDKESRRWNQYAKRYLSSYATTDADTWAKVEAMAAAGDTTTAGWRSRGNAGQIMAELDQLNIERRTIESVRGALREQYALRGWSRYYVVTSSAGHIHNDTWCSRRNATTYGWLPQFSGRSVEAMIDSEGPVMCTKCYPDAPLTATTGKVTKARAEAMSGGQVDL